MICFLKKPYIILTNLIFLMGTQLTVSPFMMLLPPPPPPPPPRPPPPPPFYMLDIFKDNTLGMLGITGPEKMPSNGIMWEEKSNGSFYTTCIYTTRRKISPPTKQNYQEVDAIDGMLMATQYDIAWRSDLFDGWDFYDASLSIEYRRHDYKLAIILCSYALLIHNDGLLNLKDYNKYRHIFIDKYIKK